MGAGDGIVGRECSGSCAAGDALLLGPRHRVGEVVALVDIGEPGHSGRGLSGYCYTSKDLGGNFDSIINTPISDTCLTIKIVPPYPKGPIFFDCCNVRINANTGYIVQNFYGHSLAIIVIKNDISATSVAKLAIGITAPHPECPISFNRSHGRTITAYRNYVIHDFDRSQRTSLSAISKGTS